MQTCFVTNDIIDRDSQHNYHPRMVSYKSLGEGGETRRTCKLFCALTVRIHVGFDDATQMG